jgi:hypothetical protein
MAILRLGIFRRPSVCDRAPPRTSSITTPALSRARWARRLALATGGAILGVVPDGAALQPQSGMLLEEVQRVYTGRDRCPVRAWGRRWRSA